MEEIRNIIKNILSSGELGKDVTLDHFVELSCLRYFHYNPEKFHIEEYDAKLLRSYFHNNKEGIYRENKLLRTKFKSILNTILSEII